MSSYRHTVYYSHPKIYYQLVKNVGVNCRQKINFIPGTFLEILQRYANFSLWYFGHACIHTPKMVKLTCRKLWCLCACQKYTSRFTFLGYYILKNSTIWLVDSILAHNWRTWIFPDIGLVVNIKITTLVFILYYFQ